MQLVLNNQIGRGQVTLWDRHSFALLTRAIESVFVIGDPKRGVVE